MGLALGVAEAENSGVGVKTDVGIAVSIASGVSVSAGAGAAVCKAGAQDARMTNSALNRRNRLTMKANYTGCDCFMTAEMFGELLLLSLAAACNFLLCPSRWRATQG